MKYEIILFDADETLFDFKKTERAALQNTMREAGIVYDEAYHLQVYRDINAALWKELEGGLISQADLNVERFKRLSEALRAGFDPAGFARSYRQHLADAAFLYEDSLDLIANLHRDYRLAIITNGLKDVQQRRIRQSAIAPYLADVVISEEVGVSKPDRRIFELALARIGHTDPRRALMVGDGLTSDIQGGINSSIDTCWFNPQRLQNRTGIRPTYEIAKLMELKKVLRSREPLQHSEARNINSVADPG